MADVTFDDLGDQLASMLGADTASELPDTDKKRMGIYLNQAYRECYTPIDGRRPRWATKEFSVSFAIDERFKDLSIDVIDVESVPELVGEGPLSPFNSAQDEIRARASYKSDFRPVPGRTFGNLPSFDSSNPEKGRPIWYWIDQADSGTDDEVIPRMYLYPVPNKAYEVKFWANIMPAELEFGKSPADKPRLPGQITYDVMLPIAQQKLLADPRYNGSNKEFIERAAAEARKRLKTFTKAQKQSTIRLGLRAGW